MNEAKEQPKLSMKILDTRFKALKADVDALKGTQTVEDGSQGLDDRIAAIEAKLETLEASTGLIMPDAIDLDKLLSALRPKAGSMWRTPA